ncbi:hypothetical protein ACOTI2_19405 [Achromobacter xylosoxidans]
MSDIYELLNKKVKEVKDRGYKGIEFYSHRHTIRALLDMKLEHREVVAFFYENVDMCKVVPAHRRINNVRLCNLMSQWKIKGYIDPDRVLKEKEKILNGGSIGSTSSINLFSYSLMDLCKEISKINNGVLPEGQTQSIKSHYDSCRDLSISESAKRWFEKYKENNNN